MKETQLFTLLPVRLDLFDAGGDGNAGSGPAVGGGPAVGSGPAIGGGPAVGSGPAVGGGPAVGRPPMDGRPGPDGRPRSGPVGPLPADRARAQLRAWDGQARQVQALYPGFDLGREAQNRSFLAMLRAGVDVRRAYEVLHMDEIKSAAAARQAQATERAVTANIMAKGTRPQENGAGASSGFTVKGGAAGLTAKDRAEMARRAARGEVITF